MIVTATEFKTNFGKYLDLILKEDIFITKNGRTVAKLTNPQINAVEELGGILANKLPIDYDRKSLREERFAKYEIND